MSECQHDPFSVCGCCGRVGAYYFGDMVNSARTRWPQKPSRGEVLERVLEHIEDRYVDGTEFATWDFAREIFLWGGSVYPCLRWLEHVGILTRVRVPQEGNKNWWRVATLATSSVTQ